MKLSILRCLAGTSAGDARNKFNLVGRPHQPGDLESVLGTTFELPQRQLANKAFEELKIAGLIASTLTDLADPENWVAITAAGKSALEHGLLDDLDVVLNGISPNLLEIRRGAWTAFASKNADSLRQAAHSARELIDQVLHLGAPDKEIKAQREFQPDRSSKSGITRRMRLRFIMKSRNLSSESDLDIADKAINLVIALTDQLSAAAHSRDIPSAEKVHDALSTSEVALRRILL